LTREFPARRGNKCFFLPSDESSCRLPSAESQFRPFPNQQTTGKRSPKVSCLTNAFSELKKDERSKSYSEG
jgi:hypothetical protein